MSNTLCNKFHEHQKEKLIIINFFLEIIMIFKSAYSSTKNRGLMNIFTYLKQVALLTLFIPLFSIPLKSQCVQTNGTIIVNSTADEGVGTLRDAINCANISPGPNRIIFQIPSIDRAIIQIGSTSGDALPGLVDDGTTIDGTTQSGFGTNGNFEPKIILDGSVPIWDAPINAITIFGNEAEIYGLEIRNFPDDGIDVQGANDVFIGDEEAGNVIYNCGIAQDFFPVTGNTGPYNGVGIVVSSDADNVEILNNIIGTDYTRSPNLGNEWAGIYIRNGSDFTLIEGNVIEGNEVGVRVRNAFGIKISENELSCNTEAGIQFSSGGNDDKAPPIINNSTNTQISGTGSAGNEIEVFINAACNISAPCQGTTFLGRTVVANNGTWVLNAPFTQTLNGGESITATASDNNNRTSTFSPCQTAVATTNCAGANGTIWVNSSNDEGTGTLRAAIECANATPGPNIIRFNIGGGGTQTIFVGSTSGEPLPFLRDGGTILDGTSQPGFGAGGIYRPLIVLDGSQHDWRFPHNAIWVRADNSEIYGLEVRNFPDDGIDVTGGDFNIIGAPNKGNVVYNCGAEKDIFEDDPNQREWNGCGIVLKDGAQNCIIQGNIVGTDYQQTATIGNEFCGIITQTNSNNNIIGGTGSGEGNIIAYHPTGISILSGTTNNRISGNQFFCNTNNGIELGASGNNQQAAPTINIASISVINGTGTNGDVIEIYSTSTDCVNGPCQGNTLIGTTTVSNNTWRLDAPFLNGIELEGGQQITSLATSPTGSTSAFGDCVFIEGIAPPSECILDMGISNFSNETCAGNDGTFTLSASNATLPITFTYQNISTQSPVFSNLSAGVYQILATDALGCSAPLRIVISQDATPTLSLVSTNNENCGSNNGGFTVLAAGGQGPYIYELSDGTFQRSPTFSNLSSGNYTVSVIDVNNCIASQPVAIQQTGNISVNIADMRDDACNAAAGSFRIAASGGQTPYTYDLGNGAVSSNQFSGLTAGNYSVTVADANNCSTVANININGGTAPVAAIDNIVQASCAQSTGSVSISVSGGSAPFQYNIGNGNVTSPTFSNLAAGNYTITVTDANNCTTNQSITINEPTSPSLTVLSSQNAACGNANGSFSVVSNNGLAPYTYDIGNGQSTSPNFTNLAEGNYTVTVYDANNCTDVANINISNSPTPSVEVISMQDASCNLNNAIITVEGAGIAPFTYDIGNGPTTNPTFSQLGEGTYTVTLTDDNNCTASTTIQIESTGGPQLNIRNTSEARCDRNNGTFTVSVFGGFEPFTFDIGDGPTSNPEFTNLAGGNYIVTLTDDNGCQATQSVTLGNIPSPTFGIGNITDASCGEANGGFNVSAIGGLAPYTFSIGSSTSDNPNFTNLAAGNYNVLVTDANNCISSLAISIDGTEMPEVEILNTQSTNCGAADGSFDLQVTGGVAPYFFDIGNGESTNSSFQNLTAGNYEVTITDASSCSQVKTIEITGESDITLLTTNTTPAACGASNGSFTLSASGGQGPYTYTVNGTISNDTVVNGLSAGTYAISTRDANGCEKTTSVEVLETEGPVLAVEILSGCGDASATINVNASQGQAPYTYDIGSGETDLSTFRDITPGLYQLVVKDAVGCQRTQSLVVNISTQEPEASIDITSQPGCNANDGQIQINVTKGVPPFLYAMSETDITPFPSFSNLSAGQYNITVTDAGGCTTQVPVTLGNQGENSPLAAFDYSFDELIGTFTNQTEDGTSYSWDFGDGNATSSNNATHTFNGEGTYDICLTATNDCGSDTYCETYTIEALNTNKSFEFDLGEVRGTVGETIKIPLYVKNFKATVGFQKSVQLEDPTVAKIIGITDVNLEGLSASLFNLKDNQWSVSWFDGSIEGLDLPDSTIIYQVEVELLVDNSCTQVIVTDDPLPTQVYKKVGNTEVEVESFKRTGQICVGDGGNTAQTANISGQIVTEDGMNISDVQMSCTNTEGQLNQIDGTYLFEALSSPNAYEITPKKDINNLNGVTTFDLVIIQNHILGNQQLDSPYKIIAADVNKTGTVTVSDILELRKLLLLDLTDFTKNESWVFVPKSYEFSAPQNPFAEVFPTSTTINLRDKNLIADFIGIKVGDVNNTATPNAFVSNESRNLSKKVVSLKVEDAYVNAGETKTITFDGASLAQTFGFQFTLKFNPDYLALKDIENNELMAKNNFGRNLQDRGYILTSWVNPNIEAIEKDALSFALTFKALKAGKLSELIELNADLLNSEAYDKDGQKIKIDLDFIEKSSEIAPMFSLSQNQPNPFANSTVINYQLPESGNIQLQIFDIQGSLLKSTNANGQKGWNKWEINRTDLPNGGVYFYKINTAYGQAIKKMLLID